MIAEKLPIVIGDANGADKTVQAYLADRLYGAVEVYCVRGNCRNNLGGWWVREVAAPHSRRDFAFYASKDEEMAKDADVGFKSQRSRSEAMFYSVEVGVQPSTTGS
jgi:hypothetical protein